MDCNEDQKIVLGTIYERFKTYVKYPGTFNEWGNHLLIFWKKGYYENKFVKQQKHRRKSAE